MYDFEGKWVAQIIGFDAKYNFERAFLQANPPGCYTFPSDGIYECCRVGEGDRDYREFVQVLRGRRYQIPASQVVGIVSNFPKVRYQRVFDAVMSDPRAIKPESAPYPSGKELIVEDGHLMPNKLIVQTKGEVWALKYNGRDGDDWSHNNVGGSWIGCYVPLDLQLQLDLGGQ